MITAELLAVVATREDADVVKFFNAVRLASSVVILFSRADVTSVGV